jgi:hypothetical protein
MNARLLNADSKEADADEVADEVAGGMASSFEEAASSPVPTLAAMGSSTKYVETGASCAEGRVKGRMRIGDAARRSVGQDTINAGASSEDMVVECPERDR